MNREEAIKKIERVKGLYSYGGDYEAFDMAINALNKYGYTKWLERKLLDTQPDVLCNVVYNTKSDWCDKHCWDEIKPECLYKCYEICKETFIDVE